MVRNANTGQAVVWSSSATSESLMIAPAVSGSFYIPSGFSGASISFERKHAGGWAAIYNASGAVSINVTADTVVVAPDELLKCGGEVRVVSAASETAVGEFLAVVDD